MNGAIRRRQYDSKDDPLVCSLNDYPNTGQNSIYAIVKSLLTYCYNNGYSKNSIEITKSECATVNTRVTDWCNYFQTVANADLSFLQWFINMPGISFKVGTKTSWFVIMPPNISRIVDFDFYSNSSPEESPFIVVFTGLTPPTTMSQRAFGYGGYYDIYVPDVAYDEYITAFKKLVSSTTTGHRYLKISELPDEYKAKIKVVNINTLIGNS